MSRKRRRISRFEVTNLARLRAALDEHNSSCPIEARAILLNPIDHGLLGYEELWGIPVVADETVPTKAGRIECEGSAARIEIELADHITRGS